VLRLPALLLYGRAIRRGTVGTLEPEEIDAELHLEEELAVAEVPGDPRPEL
jgi:hypothetical protein